MNAYDIIIAPIISEKTMNMLADKKYTFKVNANANKIEIKKAVEEVKAKILSGEIVVPKTQADFEAKHGDVYTLD